MTTPSRLTRRAASLAALAFSAAFSSAGAQPASPSLVVRAGTLFDGRSIQQNVDVVVAAGRIVAVRPASGRADIDLGARLLAPGLIDTHVHLGWYITAKGRLHQQGDGDDDATVTLNAAGNAWRLLQAGFTTVQSVGGAEDGPLRDAIARGVVPGPRVLTSLGSLSERAGPPDSVRAVIRRFKARGADVIKIFASKSIRDGGEQTMTQEQLDAACGEATALGLRSIVHAHSAPAAKAAVRARCTQVDHGVLVDAEALRMMAAAGTYFEPQCALVFRNYLDNKGWFEGIGNYNAEGFAAMERSIPMRRDLAALVRATPGLKVVYGTDAVAGAHGRNAMDMVCRTRELGVDPLEVLTSATSLSAESMGLGDRIGRIAPGFEADLVAFDGDPRRDDAVFERVVFVMRGGTVYRTPPAEGAPAARYP